MDKSLYKSDYVNAKGVRLHYLDWGGSGPVLLFIPGMGCNAYIFGEFAPRFTGQFHVLGFTRRGHGDSDHPETGYDQDTLAEDLCQFMDALHIDQAILAGHSLAYIELSRFAVMHPERVIKLVFLDAIYDRTSPENKAMMDQNPLKHLQSPGVDEVYYSFEEYVASIPKDWPALAAIWGAVMEEQARHEIEQDADGKIVDKMSDAITQAINHTVEHYEPDYTQIQAPLLSFSVLADGTDYLSSDFMTEEQKAEVLRFFNEIRMPFLKERIKRFRHIVPHAQIVIMPHGHHYCFIKQPQIVFDEMCKFLA